MKKIFKDWLTGIDGQTYDMARFLWALTVLVFLGCALYAIYKGQAWDAVQYGTGAGLVLAGGGVAIGMKAKTEPGGQ